MTLQPADDSAGEVWNGCHGIRVRGDIPLGRGSGQPIAEASVEVGAVAPASGDAIWTLRGETLIGGESIRVDRTLFPTSTGSVVVRGTPGPAVEVDAANARIRIEPADIAVQQQLVAAVALPLILHERGVLVVHAAACCDRDGAVLICGPSGAGKSTALVAAVDAGWLPVSEDLCAIDLATGEPRVWAGPTWVRIFRGEPGPSGAAVAFETPDKTAWSFTHDQPTTPQPVRQIIFVDPDIEGDGRCEPVSSPDAISMLAPHAVWLGDRDALQPALFGSLVEVATRVRASRVSVSKRRSPADGVGRLFLPR